VVDYAREAFTTLASVFGSASYNYKGKYLVTATVRQDRSSRFAPEQQGDIFPSASLGWVIDKEDFFNQNDIIQNLKLRISYGELGNQLLPEQNENPNTNISSLNEDTGYYSFSGARGQVNTGAVLNSVGNPNLSWETSVSKNLGLDFRVFENLSGTFELFEITTKDLIVQDNSLIGTTAIDASPPYVNFGNIKNTGIDFSLAYGNETESGFSYNVAFNISSYKNEVTSLINDTPQAGDSDFRGGAVTRVEVGQPISYFYGRKVTGYDNNGRFTYEDVNSDGVINDSDRTFIGSPHPDFTYGLNINLAYKNFDLAAFFNGSKGNELYNYSKIFTDFPTFFNGNRSVRVLDSWTPSNTDAALPALSETISNSETQPNSFFVEDGSFTRLKSLQLGYTFGNDQLAGTGISGLRIYLSGTNLFTITDYDGLDPEAGEANALTIGVDSGRYPLPRITSIGLSLDF
jgi:TonB-linked SusC/RagA family outer membrane protein